jgi:short-subunit dehydrogenase
MSSLDGKMVVVTGAAGGIGSIVATRLRAEGAWVAGVDRVPCPTCDHWIEGDLASEAGIAAVAAKLTGMDIDMLVNLAGVQYFGPFADQSAENLWLGYVVNLLAPSLLIRAVLGRMVARDRGRIVNIGSVMGLIPFAHFAAYSSAKAGLKALSDALRRELADTSVGVTHISPRAVRTPLATPKIMELAAATKMNMDEPDYAASRIIDAIRDGARDIVIGFPERLFVGMNAMAPRLMDRALAANDRKAAALFR